MNIISIPNDIPFDKQKLNKQYITDDNTVTQLPYTYYITVENSYNYLVKEYSFYFTLEGDNPQFLQQNSQDDFTFYDSLTGEVINHISVKFDKENKNLVFILKLNNLLPLEKRSVKYIINN